jgi:hypothetical protein
MYIIYIFIVIRKYIERNCEYDLQVRDGINIFLLHE